MTFSSGRLKTFIQDLNKKDTSQLQWNSNMFQFSISKNVFDNQVSIKYLAL